MSKDLEKPSNTYGTDAREEVARFIPEDILNLYEVYSYRHAATILANSSEIEFNEILSALRIFRLSQQMIILGGGNESGIPKKFSELLRPQGWFETQIQGDLLITLKIQRIDGSSIDRILEEKKITRSNFLDGHKIDYVKNRVAFDLEWNSKDQTFDRDLYAVRAFYDCGLISAAILMTRSVELNPIFTSLGVKNKYGASTTWMGKLLYRLNAGRNGGCPILVFGITPKLINDLEEPQ